VGVGVALLLGGDFFTGTVLASVLTTLVLRFDEKVNDKATSNVLHTEVPLLSTLVFNPRTHYPHSP
jgi:coatomer subunit beta